MLLRLKIEMCLYHTHLPYTPTRNEAKFKTHLERFVDEGSEVWTTPRHWRLHDEAHEVRITCLGRKETVSPFES
jgi:hypothetical protein